MEALQDLYLTYQSTLAYMGLNALLALSVYATLSCGQLALSNAGFMAIGAYAATLLTMEASAPFPLALAASALLPAVVAVPLGLPVLRLKGVFLAMGPEAWRSRLVEWCLNRDDVDYRFVGIGLCTLAALLLHALGWLGQD